MTDDKDDDVIRLGRRGGRAEAGPRPGVHDNRSLGWGRAGPGQGATCLSRVGRAPGNPRQPRAGAGPGAGSARKLRCLCLGVDSKLKLISELPFAAGNRETKPEIYILEECNKIRLNWA